MTERAYQAIQRILKNRGKAQPLIVGGYSNFLFLNREGLPKVAGNYEGMVRGLIKKYNKYHTDKLPNITPHSFRHTYCTNMANRGMNPNTLQYLMGHANITMTLGYYAHGTFQSAKAELERLACLYRSLYLLLIYYFWLHFHAGKCQLMQGIFRKENTDKALKYGIYRHLPTYEKIIRNLVSFYDKKPYQHHNAYFQMLLLLCSYKHKSFSWF